MRAGDLGTEMFVILSGEVEVQLPGTLQVRMAHALCNDRGTSSPYTSVALLEGGYASSRRLFRRVQPALGRKAYLPRPSSDLRGALFFEERGS